MQCRLYSVNTNYFSTDNAKVTAKLYSVMPVTNGKLISWDVENGDLVEQDQVLGRQETLPYITSPISGTVVKNDGAVNQMAPARLWQWWRTPPISISVSMWRKRIL